MARRDGDGGWLYHLPGFLDRVRDQGAHRVGANVGHEVEGVLYHHRGARVPAHDATFVWADGDGDGSRDVESGAGTSDLELDAVGSRAAWVRFDAAREWDFFLTRAPGDAPCLAWMTDGEFSAEEADDFGNKRGSMSMLRFSFGLYLQSPDAWPDLEAPARGTDAPWFIYRPGGHTLVPEADIAEYEGVLPAEQFGGAAPPFLGVVEAHVEGG